MSQCKGLNKDICTFSEDCVCHSSSILRLSKEHINTTEYNGTLQHFNDSNLKDTFHIDAQPIDTKIIGGGWVAVPSENVLEVLNPALEGLRNKAEMLKPAIEGLRTLGDKENEEMTRSIGVPVENYQQKLELKDTEIARLERQIKEMEVHIKQAEDRTERDERELRQFKAERRGQYALEVYRTVNASQNYNKQTEILTDAAVTVIIEQLKVEPEPVINIFKDQPEECCEEPTEESKELYEFPDTMYFSLSGNHRELHDQLVKSVAFQRVGEKTTIAVITTKAGFEIVGTSACVNPENFNYDIGKHYAQLDAYRKLEEYNGFHVQSLE